jgi:hypothetical protein
MDKTNDYGALEPQIEIGPKNQNNMELGFELSSCVNWSFLCISHQYFFTMQNIAL